MHAPWVENHNLYAITFDGVYAYACMQPAQVCVCEWCIHPKIFRNTWAEFHAESWRENGNISCIGTNIDGYCLWFQHEKLKRYCSIDCSRLARSVLVCTTMFECTWQMQMWNHLPMASSCDWLNLVLLLLLLLLLLKWSKSNPQPPTTSGAFACLQYYEHVDNRTHTLECI